MSSAFRETTADLENGFAGYIPQRRTLRIHAPRPIHSNSLAFLFTALLLFMILNSQPVSPNFLVWLVVGVFLVASSLRVYATCRQLRAQPQPIAVATSGVHGQTELRLHMPSSLAFAARGRLQGLRLQLALLDQDLDELDYETLGALDLDNVRPAPAMTEEEINTLPVHEYKVVTGQQSDGSLEQLGTSSLDAAENTEDSAEADESANLPEDELTCTVCLEQVNVGEMIRSLPCLHQFHVNCIDPWLRQQGSCPVCKFRAISEWRETALTGVRDAYMV